jgi:uncharacterized protein YcbK (DUF882 family)
VLVSQELAAISKLVRSALAPFTLAALAASLLAASPVYAGVDAGARETVHLVAKGQTLYAIAKRYRVTVNALREANGLGPRERLHPGLSLVIPARNKDGTFSRKAPEPSSAGRGGGATATRQTRADRGHKRGNADDEEPAAEPAFRGPRRRGWVRLVRGTDKLEVQMLTRRGRLAPNALAGLSQMLRFGPTGAKTGIDPRLAVLVGQVSEHFGGRTLRVVSGFRPYTPAQYTAHSNHNLGRAMDFSVEGIPNAVLRDFCKTFPNAGVGYYPNSSFVHLDVRSGKAAWVDYAGPGEAPRYEGQRPPNVDESTRDVEPHAGATDGENPLNAPDDGSR